MSNTTLVFQVFSGPETISIMKLLLRYYEKSVIFSFEEHIKGVSLLSVDFSLN